jgi:4-amino-4-deoxy-L-arabinose transferase-like glycosyltransferase
VTPAPPSPAPEGDEPERDEADLPERDEADLPERDEAERDEADLPERDHDGRGETPHGSAPRRGAGLASPWVDRGVAAALFGAVLVGLVKSAAAIGYARDEGFYFHAASVYGRFFEALRLHGAKALERPFVDGVFRVNHEHPALMKSLFSLSHQHLQVERQLFALEGTSYRFPAMVTGALAVALVYLWGVRALGRSHLPLVEARLGALVGALSLALMPAYFHHAHLACFDVPIVALWTLVALLHVRSLEEGGALWPLATGVAFGLALDTKHNSWFLPIAAATHLAVLLAVALVMGDRALAKRRLARALPSLASMLLVGPAVLVAGWPWLWWDTKARWLEYARFHLEHEYYNMEFLGVTYWQPPMPRSYAPLMTLATVPTVTLALGLVGFVVVLRALARPLVARALGGARSGSWLSRALARRSPVDTELGLSRVAGVGLFWCAGLTINYAAWLSAKTPIFGGTKHWMTAYPFLALFAAVGAALTLRAARGLAARHAVPEVIARALVVASLVAGPLALTVRSHPWGLAYYVPLVGGPAGAASLGLNRSFWGYTTGAAIDWLNREAPRGATVYIHDTAGQAWDMHQRDGRLRRDLRGVWSAANADFVLYHHEQHMLGQEYQAWLATGTLAPAFVAGPDGVPTIWIYRRAKALGPSP